MATPSFECHHFWTDPSSTVVCQRPSNVTFPFPNNPCTLMHGSLQRKLNPLPRSPESFPLDRFPQKLGNCFRDFSHPFIASILSFIESDSPTRFAHAHDRFANF